MFGAFTVLNKAESEKITINLGYVDLSNSSQRAARRRPHMR